MIEDADNIEADLEPKHKPKPATKRVPIERIPEHASEHQAGTWIDVPLDDAWQWDGRQWGPAAGY